VTAFVAGFGDLLIGAAYVALGVLALWEAISQYRYRGLTRFGLGCTLLGSTCGPHHLGIGWHVMRTGDVSTPGMLGTLLGVPGVVVFCWLRIEAMLGGRGDRTIRGTPFTMGALTAAFFAGIGWLVGRVQTVPSLTREALCTFAGLSYVPTLPGGILWLALASNVCAAIAYLLVGWHLLMTQVRRCVTSHHWSLSGLSLVALFSTCASTHLIHALTYGSHSLILPFDLLGVPASIWFLWTVRQVHQDSVVDWNRRPLAGIAAKPERSSPWSGMGG
jgi:hypothetical protein